jgi:hypothetical protein
MTAAPDYGTDTSCTDSLRTGRLVSGARLVAEACYRRLSTPRGTLIGGEDEEDYGLDLADKIGSIATKADVAALPGQIEAELLKDDRLESVEVDVTATWGTSGAVSLVVVVAGQTGAGPFKLTLGVSQVSVDILGLQAE